MAVMIKIVDLSDSDVYLTYANIRTAIRIYRTISGYDKIVHKNKLKFLIKIDRKFGAKRVISKLLPYQSIALQDPILLKTKNEAQNVIDALPMEYKDRCKLEPI